GFSRGFHIQRLVRAPVVVKAYPVADHATSVLQGFEAVPVGTLLFKRSDDPFHHAVLLWAVWRNELLAQAVAANQRRIAATGKNETVVRPKQERFGDTP